MHPLESYARAGQTRRGLWRILPGMAIVLACWLGWTVLVASALVVGFFTAAAFTARVFGGGQWDADDFVRAVEGSSDAPPVVVTHHQCFPASAVPPGP